MFSEWFARLFTSSVFVELPSTFEQLEERIVLDAAVAATVENQVADQSSASDTTHGSTDSDASTDSTTSDQEDSSSQDAQDSQTDASAIATDSTDTSLTADTVESTAEVRVLVVSSSVSDADLLVSAAQEGVITISYDSSQDSLDTLLSEIRSALGDQKADSIAFATHDLGEGRFVLTDSYSVSPSSLAGSDELQAFWQGVGSLLATNGRIDLLVCDLASTDVGTLLISQLETLTGHTVAASDDPVGNSSAGGDWILETDEVDVASIYFVQSTLSAFEGTLSGEDKLTLSDGSDSEHLGYSVSISGDYAVVGVLGEDVSGITDAGAAYIYHRDTGSSDWTLVTQLTASDPDEYAGFGRSVAISGDYVIVGEYYADPYGTETNEGAAYVFMRNEGGTDNWGLVTILLPSVHSNGDHFGYSVAISDDYVVVGAKDADYDGNTDAGLAFVFYKDEGGTDNWGQVALLEGSDSLASDYFGTSVAISGDYVIVGAPYADIGTIENAGAAYIFEKDEGGTDNWGEEAKLVAADAEDGDRFGCSVAISEYCAIVGAPYDTVDGIANAGSAYAFFKDYGGTDTWGQTQKLVASTTQTYGTGFGWSVSMSGDYAAIAAWHQDVGSATDAGAVYVFLRNYGGNDNWGEVVAYEASDPQKDDALGFSVAISGTDVIAGAPNEDEQGSNAGAAYIFSGSLDVPPEILSGDVPAVSVYEDQESAVAWLTGRDANSPDASEVHFVIQDENGDYQIIDNSGTSSINVAHGTITFQDAVEGGDYTYAQAFIFTPDENYWGEFDISYYFASTDGTQSDVMTFHVVVKPVNDSPVILESEVPSVTVDEDETSIVFTLTAYDEDNDDASSVNFVVDGQTISNSGGSTVTVTNGVLTALGGVVSDGNGKYTQQFTFTPDADYTGLVSLSYYFKTPAPASSDEDGQTLGSESRTCVALGDVDGDGDVDIVLGGGGSTAIWLNDGTGTFSDSGQSLDASDTQALALGDVDGDGDIDIVQGTGSYTKIWLNDGTGVFSDSGQSLASSGANALALGDVDGNGYLDLVVADGNGIKLWLNDGSGTFYSSGRSFKSGEATAVALGDMDGDGDLDIVANNGGRLHVSLNNGSGWFTELSTPNSSTADCIVLDDLDGDGDLDIVEGRNSSNARIWLNNGSGTGFTSYSISDFSWSWCVATLDVNGDGHPDLFLGGRTFINDGTGQSYTLSESLAASASLLGAASADLNGDGWDDLVTAAQNQVWLTVTEMEKSSSRILEITVNPVNDAPVLADTDPALSPLTPNETNSPGDTVTDIVTDGSVTDVDVNPSTSAPQAIAVTWVDNTNGYWEYSTDGGTTWTRFSDIHGSGVDLSTTAVLLDESDQNRIRFVPDTDWHGTATFQYSAWDETEGTNGGTLDATNSGGTTALSSFVETATITVNEAPVLSDLDGTMVYTENSGAQVIDGDITLSDGDSDTIISATVQITGNYQSGEDSLSIADEDLLGGVSATWDETTGTLTLTGSTTKANYESMLEHITYTNSSDDPITLDRTVSWAVYDDFHGSSSKTSTIEVAAVNDAPILALSHSAGGLDSTFGDDGIVITDIHTSSGNFVAFCTVIQADGKIVVGGEDGHDFTLVRYNSDGSLDTTFGDNGIVTTNIADNDRVYSLAIQSDGKIVAVGRSQDSGGGEDFAVARYNSDGSLDTTFSGDGIIVINNWTYQNDTAYAVAIDSDGNIVVVGRTAVGSGHTDFYVIRIDENGNYDSDFGSNGKVSTDMGSSDIAYGVALQDDGKIVIVGTTGSNVAVLRYNADGTLDDTFSGDGKVSTNLGGSSDCAYSVVIQSDGKIVVAGSDGEDCVILRYNSDGTLDDTFGDDGIVTTDLGGSSDCAYSVAIDSDGKIVVTGVTDAGSSKDFVLVRYNSDGTLDETFNGTGVVTTDVSDGYSDVARAVALQSDGLIVVAGYASNGTHNEFAVARYGTGGPAEYTEGDPPIVLENTITLSDVDNTDMASATIQITGNYQEGADTLGIDEAYLVSGVTVNWNAVTGTLTLSGLASKADYESMLEHVTYENTSDDPSTSDRTVTWTVYDGTDWSEAQASTITVTAVNDAPEGTDNTITIDEDTTYTLTVADFGFSDIEGDEFVSLTITQVSNVGTLQLNGVDVTLNQVITRTDVEAGALTFTPAPDANGVGCDSFQFAVTDDGGTANEGQDTDQTPNTIIFDVIPVDDVDPTAGPDSFTTAEDTAVIGTVVGNDSVGADTPATWSQLTDPSNGTLVFNADGTFTYTPNADFNGTDSFTYTLTDSDGEAATATVTITVTPVNDAPEGTDNTITINEDTTYTLTLADFGFSDIDGDEFACVHITELPTAGELQLDGVAVTLNQVISIADIDAGKLTFTPEADANGVGCDSFQFAVTDDGGTANGGQDTDQTPNTITFDVTPTDDVDPSAEADAFTTDEDTAVSDTVADNDSVGVDTPATWSKLTDPSNGTLVFNADGTFTYTPNADFNGTDSFTYTLTDSDGETTTATATITVTPVDDTDPIAGADSFSTAEDTALNDTVAGNDSVGVDGPATWSKLTDPSNGTLVFNDDGTFTYTPNADFNGTDSFTYTLTDSDGETATATVTITVTPVDDADPIAGADSFTTTEDTAVSGTVAGNDSVGVDTPATWAKSADPSNGTLVFNDDGTFTYTPNANFNGTDSFTYTLTDSDGETATATVTITVTPVDDADPVAGADSFTTTEDTAVSGTVAGNDSVGADTPSNWSKLTDPDNGTLVFNADGTFTYTPNANFNGTDSFTYTLTDSDGETATATVTITVTPVDDADPNAGADSFTTDEDTALNDTVAGNDSVGVDGPATWSKLTDPSNGTLVLNADGTFTYTPNADFNGTDSFTYTLTDSDGETATATVTITVTPVDDDDPIAGADVSLTAEDTAVTGTVAGNDSVGVDTPATWAKLTDPSNGTLVFNADGTFTYTPNADFNGTDSFTYTLTDSDGETATATVTITVTPVADAPAGTDNTITINEDTTYTLTVADFGFTDVDADNFAYVQITVLPAAGKLELDGSAVTVDQLISTADIDAGKLTFTPDADACGIGYASFGFAVIDDGGNTAGTLDTSFGGGDGIVTTGLGGNDAIQATAIQSDGKIVVAGSSGEDFALARYNTDGSLDTTFGGGDGIVKTALDGQNCVAYDVAIQSDGKIVVTGEYLSTSWDLVVLRYNSDGSLDTSFGGGDGIVTTHIDRGEHGYDVAIQSDGKIVVAGYYEKDSVCDFLLVRYNSDGSLDKSFGGGDGIVTTNLGGAEHAYAVAIQSNGKIVVVGDSNAGGAYDFAVVRYNSDGSLDKSFGGGDGIVTTNLGSIEYAYAVAIQSDGKIVVAGDSNAGGTYDFAVVRYNANGSLDKSFGDGDGIVTTSFGATDVARALVMQADGKIVAAGYSGSGSSFDFALARYNSDGSLDTGFGGGDGMVTTSFGANESGYSAAIQPDGQIVVAGRSNAGGNYDFAVARYCAGTGEDTDQTPNTITFDVIPVDDADPIAGADSFTTDEDTEVSGTVADNDSVGADTPATWSQLTDPSNGTLVFNADGTFTYTPNANFNGTDSFTYTLTDSDGETATATVTIAVTPVDDADPIAGADSFTTAEDSTLSDTVAGNDSVGVDTPATWSTLTNPTNGTLVFNDDGTFTYTPHADFNGTDSFTYTLTDSDGESVTATVTITVTPVDDADPTAGADAFTTDEDTALSGTVAGNDSVGVDTPAMWSKLTDPSNGTLVFNDDGTFTYTPDADFNGTDSFTYTLTDSDGETTTATVTITVTPVDDADPIAGTDSFTTDEDTALSGTVAGNDSAGVDTPATWSKLTDPNNGTLVFNDNGTFTYTPNADFNGTDSFTYTLTDSDGETTTATATITVTAVDDAPTAILLSNDTVAENAGVDAAVGTLSATDPDSGETFTYTLVSGEGDSGNSFFSISGDTLMANDSFDYETGPTAYSIRVQVTDSTGLTREEQLTINVTNVNEAPVLSDLGETLAYTENDPATVIDNTITIADVDNQYLSSATIQITGNYLGSEDVLGIDATYVVGGVSATWDASTGTLTLTGSATIGQYESMLEHVTYSNISDNPNTADRSVAWTVSDGSADAVAQTSTITVATVNDAPMLSDLATTVVYAADTGAQVLDADLSIQDLDNTTISCATICITGNYVGGTDVLGIDSSYLLSGVTANWDSASGTLSLSGNADIADYEYMLEHVTYSTVSNHENTDNRVVTWSVSDGDRYAEANTTIALRVENSQPTPYLPYGQDLRLQHESEPSARTPEPSPKIGNILSLLSSGESLPSFLTTVPHDREIQTESSSGLLDEALYAETEEARHQTRDSAMPDLDQDRSRDHTEQLLGLESFLSKLRDWTTVYDLKDIRLSFNADDIHLCEWFASLKDSPDATSDIAGATQVSSVGWLNDHAEHRSFAVNIDELKVADLIFMDEGSMGQAVCESVAISERGMSWIVDPNALTTACSRSTEQVIAKESC